MTLLPELKSPLSYREQRDRYRFVLTAPLTIYFPKEFFPRVKWIDQYGEIWVRTDGREWTISEGYAWDGCSPKVFAFGKFWGTPDFRSTLAASCWHDSAGQCRLDPCMRPELPGWKWNERFAEIIAAQGCPKLARVYHLGLTLGNPLYAALGRLSGAEARSQLKRVWEEAEI